jgi:RNase P subunit RPR2
MQTYSEYKDRKKNKDQQKKQHIIDLLENSKNISTDDEEDKVKFREIVLSGKFTLYNILCDNCRTQLINPHPGVELETKPVKFHISCVGCGWSGYFKR